MSTFETLKVEVDGTVGVITLDRPKALNAINTQMVEELGQALDAWKDLGLAAVILTGEGKAFAAGADISQMSGFTATQAQQFALSGQRTLRKLEHFPAPTIAAVNGFALGGGCELAMCCDIILASPYAKFGQPEVNLGVIPGFGGTQRLVRRVGRQAALELMMTGRIVRADEAVSLGIALRIEEDVMAGAHALAGEIAKKGPVAVRLVKEVVDTTDRLDTDAGLAVEASAFGLCFATTDQTEGMQASSKKEPQILLENNQQQSDIGEDMFTLPESTLEIQQFAKEFVAEWNISETSMERDRTHEFPTEIVKAMGENGFMGMFIPEEYGGMGLTVLDYVVALEEICYADAGVGVIMSVNNSLVCWPILKFGSEEQKQKYLRPLASGEKLGCYALTEPNAGSDAGSQQTRYEEQNGGYVLNGTKIWITNGPQADICVTYANKDVSLRHRGVSAFVFETTTPGFSVGKVEEKLGIACSGTSELVYENMALDADNMMHVKDKGFAVAMATLDGGRVGIAAQALGIAQRALDLAISHAKQREQFGKPIATKQAIQWMIADMATKIESARLLTWKAATIKDAEMAGTCELSREEISRACSMAKLAASECANFCADKALQIHGGYGYSKEYEVERLYRDARITTLYEGTSEIQRVVISASLLK